MRKGFVQIPLLIAIIVGVLVIGGAGYVGVRQYQNFQAKQIEEKRLADEVEKTRQEKDEQTQDLIAAQQKTIEEAKNEVQKTNEKISALENKVKNQGIQQEGATISAVDLNPYLSGVVNLDCGLTEGSGSLWDMPPGYIVLTNNHVVRGNNTECTFNPLSNDDKYGMGVYKLDMKSKYRWNSDTDVAAMSFAIDQVVNDAMVKVSGIQNQSRPIEKLNYAISTLRKCPTAMPLGSPVALIGYPAFTYKQIDVPDTNSRASVSSRTITNGVISALDRTVTYPIGNLPYPNYFVSAKIDSGNSGGITFSKDENGLCVLGIPTWLTVGNYETQGLVQNIHNVMYKR